MAVSPVRPSILPQPVAFTMETKQGKVQVFLGPNWYVEEQGFKIAPLKQIEVTGSRLVE